MSHPAACGWDAGGWQAPSCWVLRSSSSSMRASALPFAFSSAALARLGAGGILACSQTRGSRWVQTALRSRNGGETAKLAGAHLLHVHLALIIVRLVLHCGVRRLHLSFLPAAPSCACLTEGWGRALPRVPNRGWMRRSTGAAGETATQNGAVAGALQTAPRV